MRVIDVCTMGAAPARPANRKGSPPAALLAVCNAGVVPGEEMTINPPAGWSAQWRFGLLRYAQGEDARLVRLADVLRFLMDARELPLRVAVEEICRRIETANDLRLYFVDECNYAKPMDESCPGWDELLGVPEAPAERRVFFANRAAEQLRAVWLMPSYALERLVNNPQFPSDDDYNASKQTPFDYCEQWGRWASRFSVTFLDAHRLWGWGHQVAHEQSQEPHDLETLAIFRKNNPGAPWPIEHKRLLRRLKWEMDQEPGAREVAKRLAAALRIGVPMVNRLIREADKPSKRETQRLRRA